MTANFKLNVSGGPYPTSGRPGEHRMQHRDGIMVKNGPLVAQCCVVMTVALACWFSLPGMSRECIGSWPVRAERRHLSQAYF